jgi:hypothetical protein
MIVNYLGFLLYFDNLVYIEFVFVFIIMSFIASKLEDPSRKRVKNIENMLIKHIEDAKFTIDTMQNIKTKVNNQDYKLDQILQKVS